MACLPARDRGRQAGQEEVQALPDRLLPHRHTEVRTAEGRLYLFVASAALQRITGLYRLEAAIRGQALDEPPGHAPREGRGDHRSWSHGCARSWLLISKKTKLAEAIRYALSSWQGLTLFLDDGRVELDNNIVERSIRPLALTRKNALFAGSDGGAGHWAVIVSLVETASLTASSPPYLANVINHIVNGHPKQPHRRPHAHRPTRHSSHSATSLVDDAY